MAAIDAPWRWWTAANGFTLIEMLVVLALIGMAMTVAPTIISGLAGARLRAAADDMIAQLRTARGQALRRSALVEVRFDLAKRSYTLSSDAAVRMLPPVVDALSITPKELLRTDGIARVRFLADGSADPARITLLHGASRKTVAVDWLTGRVRHDD